MPAANIVVYDFGGGTLDVSLLSLEGGVFEVVAACGDEHLGGEDLNQELVEHLLADFRTHTGLDAARDVEAVERLRIAVEAAKVELSSASSTRVHVADLLEGQPLARELTRGVGGTTRVPRIRALMHEFFGKEPNWQVDPDQAVAWGTAVQAGILTDAKGIKIAATEYWGTRAKRCDPLARPKARLEDGR
jgi:endoplasmic reticulum chaperone BiP